MAPLGISAEAEGRYADEKRADIKVSAQGHHIPVEIKREMHRDLWKAIQNQLIARYTRELASDSYGIFLVFWFGGTGQPVAGDGGTRPKTAMELQQRLTVAGFSTAGVDGRVGPRTLNAIKGYQRAQGQVADGFASIDLLDMLRATQAENARL